METESGRSSIGVGAVHKRGATMDALSKVITEHPLLTVLGIILAAYASGWGSHVAILAAMGRDPLSKEEVAEKVAAAKEPLETRLAQWAFSEPLYKSVPGDMDFLVRGLDIEKEVGKTVSVAGPGADDWFRIGISELVQHGDRHGVVFSLRANLETNVTLGGAEFIEDERHSMAGPFQAGMYEFYVFIDDVRTNKLKLSVARRRISTKMRIEGGFGPIGSIKTIHSPPPPVLVSSPKQISPTTK